MMPAVAPAVMRWTVLGGVAAVLMAAAAFALPAQVQAEATDDACWGQATAVFAQMGVMGEHASEQETPRVGLRNLARALYEQGVIEDDTLQALGAFVSAELGLSVDACQ